ncbi:MAG: hypothetical protein ACKV2U_34425 [Bryobacteraceae bacterium]
MTDFYTGREISWTEALEQANTVVLGRVIATGKRDLGSIGQAYYDQASVDVERWLRTRLPKDGRPKQLNFAYTLQILPEAGAERAPAVGERLLFLSRMQRDGSMNVIKILSPSGDEARFVDRELPPQSH